MSNSYFEDAFKNTEQRVINELSQIPVDEFEQLRRKQFEDQYRRSINPIYNEKQNEADLRNIQQRALQDNLGDLELQARDRVEKLVEQGIRDPNQLLRIIKSDPVLSKRYPTDAEAIDVIHSIQQAVEASRDPNAVLGDKVITGETGFWNNLLRSAKNTFAGTVGGLIYDTQRNQQLNELSKLPLKDLEAINKKLQVRDELQGKLIQAKQNLFSSSKDTRDQALKDITYLDNAIKNLGLSPEEQEIYNTYGSRYNEIKGNIDDLNYKKEHFWGSNEITQDMAERLVNKAKRDNFYKTNNIDPSFFESAIDGLRDSLGNPGEELGMILGYAAPLLIGGYAGVAIKGASLLSEAATTSADLMEQYIKKHGELPDEKVLSATVHGLFTAIVDQYLTHGLVAGKGYARGALRGIGLSEADRLAEQAVKDSLKQLKGLTKGVDINTQAFASTRVLGVNLTKQAETLQEFLKKSATAEAAEQAVKNSEKGIMGKALSAVSIPENMRRAKKFNDFLHNRLGTGIQDVAKAGASLAVENAGSTLIRQNYDDEFDLKEVAESVGQGLATGSMSHVGGAVPGIAVRKGMQVAKEIKDKISSPSPIDEDRTFDKFIDNISNDSSQNPSELLKTVDAYTTSHTDVRDGTLKDLKQENADLKKKFEGAGLKFDATTGEASVDTANVPPEANLKTLKSIASKYNKNASTIDSLESKLDSRITRLEALKQTIRNKALTSPKTTASVKQDIYNDIILNSTDMSEAIKAVKDSNHITDDVLAERMVNEYRDRANSTPKEVLDKLSDTQKDLYKTLNGMISYTDLMDIRDDAKFIDAIKSGDAKDVADAIDATSLSTERKNYLKNVLNQDMLDNLGRSSAQVDNISDVTKLDRTTKNMVKKHLIKNPIKDVNDIKSVEDAKDYIYNDILNNNKNLQNDTALDKAISDIDKSSVDQAIKDAIKNDKTNILNELNTALDKSNEFNNQIKKYRSKTFAKEEDAQKALEAYHKDASKMYYVDKIENKLDGTTKYIIKDNYVDTSEATTNFRNDITKNSAMTEDEFFKGLENIVETFNHGLKDPEDFTPWFEKMHTKFEKETKGITDTAKLNAVKLDILDDLQKATVNRLAKNLKTVDVESLSAGKTKIHRYTTDKKEELIKNKQRALIKKRNEADEKALKVADEESKNIDPDLMKLYTYSVAQQVIKDLRRIGGFQSVLDGTATSTIFPSNIQPLNLSKADIITLRSYFKTLSAMNASEANMIRNILSIANHIGIINPEDTTTNRIIKPSKLTAFPKLEDIQELNQALIRFYDVIPRESRVLYDYNQLPEDAVNSDEAFYDYVERTYLNDSIEKMNEFLADIVNPAGSNAGERVLGLLRELRRQTYQTKSKTAYNLLQYLASLYDNTLLNADGSLAQDLPTTGRTVPREWANLFIKGLQSANPTLRVILGLQPGVSNVRTTNIEDISTWNLGIISRAELQRNTDGLLNWNTVQAALNITGTQTTVMDKINAFAEALGSDSIRDIVYAGMDSSHVMDITAKEEILRNDVVRFGLSEAIRNNTIFTSIFNNILSQQSLSSFTSSAATTTTGALTAYTVYNSIVHDFITTANPSTYFNRYLTSGNTLTRQNLATLQRNFSNLLKYHLREYLKNDLNTYIQNQANPANPVDVTTTPTYSSYMSAIHAVASLPDTVQKYNQHTAEDLNTVNGDALSRLIETIKYFDYRSSRNTSIDLDTIINAYNAHVGGPTRSAVTGAPTSSSAHLATVSIDTLDRIKKAFTASGDVYYIRNIKETDITNLSDADKLLLSKVLAQYINANNIWNTVSISRTTATNDLQNFRDVTLEHSGLLNTILASPHYKYLSAATIRNLRDKRISPILLRDLEAQINTINPNANATQILEIVNEIAKHGYSFTKCLNEADTLFGTDYAGHIIYSKEMLRALALVGASSLSTVSSGQSDQWLDKQVASGRLSKIAANAMRANNFIDYQTFSETLGGMSGNLVPIKFSENAPGSLENSVKLGLGVRALNLLEASGQVTKYYFNTQTGEYTSTQPTDLRDWVRVLAITDRGNTTADKINDMDTFTSSSGTHSVVKSLLGEPRDAEAYVDNASDGGANAWEDAQNHRETRWNEILNDPERHIQIEQVEVNGYNYEFQIDTNSKLGRVTCLGPTPATAASPGAITNSAVFNGRATFYFTKKQIVKPQSLDTLISYDAMVEEAYKSSIGYKVNMDKWNQINRIIDNIQAKHTGIKASELYKYMTSAELDMFGMDDPDKVQSFQKQYVFNKNRAIWRQVLQFREDITRYGITDASRLFYDVINTHNNRFYVDSIHLNYREFKLFRELFTPDDTQHAPDKYDIEAAKVQANQDLMYAFLLHNLGVSVDKMNMTNIHAVAEGILKAINDSPTDFNNYVQEYVNAFRTGNLVNLDTARKNIDTFFAKAHIVYTKVPISTGKDKVFKIDKHNLFTVDVLERLPELLSQISKGEAVTDFHYVMEVDGLNNGTSIHYAQSGLFGDNTVVSIDKLTSIGIFQGVNVNKNSGVILQDYIEAAYTGSLDAYLQSAAVASDKSKAQQYRDLLRESAVKDTKLQDCIVTLGCMLGLTPSNYNDVLNKLTDRDIIKYVSMPNSYGAGAAALTNYIYDNITKQCSQVIAEIINNTDLKVDEKYNRVRNIYDNLDRLNKKNGGTSLMLLDENGKSITYADALSKVNSSETKDAFLRKYLPDISSNIGLNTIFKEGIVQHILDGAAYVTGEANHKKQLYTEATESLMELYVATVQEMLNTDQFRGRDPKDFTNRDLEILTNSVCTKFSIGMDKQKLDLLKQAVMPAISLASYRNKVQGFTDEGIYDVVSTKDLLSKDPNVTGFNPESVHTIDKDIISRSGAKLRELFGTFVGIHDAAIVDVNQLIGVGKELNKQYLESVLESYKLPLQIAYTLEQQLSALRDSNYLGTGAYVRGQRAIQKLRDFATLDVTSKITFLNQAIENDKKYQKDNTHPRTIIKQYAFGSDEFVVDKATAEQYIKNITNTFTSTTYTPRTLNNFLDYVVDNYGNDSDLVKNLKELVGKVNVYYPTFDTFRAFINSSAGGALATSKLITDPSLQTQLIEAMNNYDTHTNNINTDSFYNDVVNSFTRKTITNTKISIGRATAGCNNNTVASNLMGMFASCMDTVLVNNEGNIHNGVDNSFITQFILNNVHKVSGLTNTHPSTHAYTLLSSIAAMTSSSHINTMDLNTLSDFMKDIDKELKLSSYDNSKEAMIMDIDDIPLKPFLDTMLTEARRLNLRDPSIPIQTAMTNNLRVFADSYIEGIKKKVNKNYGPKTTVQLVFKCDSAIDRILISRINELSKSGNLGFAANICVVPNINNLKSNDINKNVHYYSSLLTNYTPTDNRLEVLKGKTVFSVLNQSNNKDLVSRNFLYQNQFNVAGLIDKTAANKEFAYSYSNKSGSYKNSKCLNIDPDGIMVADYYGRIQRTVSDGVITSDVLATYDSYDANGYSTYQSDIKRYNSIDARDLSNLIRSAIDLDTDPNNFDYYRTNIDLNEQDIPDFENDSHLVFSIDSSGNMLDSKEYNSIIKENPELEQALKDTKKMLESNTEFLQQNTNINRDSLYPPISKKVFINGVGLNIHFVVKADYKISLADVGNLVMHQTDPHRKGEYVINPENELRFLFSKEVRDDNVGLNDPSHPMNVFLRNIYNQYISTPEGLRKDTYIDIPRNLRDPSANTLSEKAHLINTMAMYNILHSTTPCHIFGVNTNDYGFITSGSQPYVYNFGKVKQGAAAMSTVSNSFKTAMYNSGNRVMDSISRFIQGHNYTIDKDQEVLSNFKRAVFLDTNCDDLENTFNSLAASDRNSRVNPKETEICREVFNELKGLNTKIRIAFKENASKRNGFAAVLDKDPESDYKPTGYVYLETASNGSNVTTLTHELVHIPLHYLSRDPKANHMAVEMYNFIADNLRMSDFTCSDEQASEIYNYLFRDANTTEPYVECLDMLLTEKAFIDAVNRMNKRLDFKKEFDARSRSILSKFIDKVTTKLEPNDDFHDVAMQILKRSIDIANTYNQKAEKPDLGYLSDPKGVIATLNREMSKALGKFLDKTKIFDKLNTPTKIMLKSFIGRSAEVNMVSPAETNDEIEELMPLLVETVSDVARAKGSVADEFKQSFEGVSKNNYDYVKLRYMAKEEVDKQREVASTAVNSTVSKLTANLSTKTLANMSKAVLKTDVSSLLNGMQANDAKSRYNTKQYLKRTLEDEDYRKNQIINLERNLKKYPYGNYYINASKGLANKLVFGINTSGIGYNNAYEIATFSGTKMAMSSNPEVEAIIDKYVTLRAMQLYSDEHSNVVYNDLANDINNFYELSVMHNKIKDIEKTTVYGDSLQKNHIPKGELHGSTHENSFAIVPESEVKAYTHLGYKKLRKATLDEFYKKVTTEPHYIMEGRALPNVAYIDGIPVLTDVFNGRNQSGINLNGSRLVNNHIDPRYNNTEFTNVSNYLNNLVTKLNKPDFKVHRVSKNKNEIDGVITPTFGLGNRLTGADFVLNSDTKEKILGMENKYTTALGDHYGSIIERVKAPEWNTKAAEALDEIYKNRRADSDFTWLNDSVENPDLLEVYNLLPYELKSYFNARYANKGVPIETKYLTGIAGYREVSANKLDKNYYKQGEELRGSFGSKKEYDAYLKLRNSTVGYLSHLFHSGPMAKFEYYAKWLTRIGKLNTVVKSVGVSVDNITSNCVTLGLLGLSPTKVCQYQAEGLQELVKFKELKKEKAIIEAKAVTGTLSDADRAKIRSIDSAISSTLIGYMAEKGGLPTIAEDISQPDRLLKDTIDKYIPKPLQGLAHGLAGDEKSYLLRTLTDLSCFGDITARYAQLKYLTEDQNLNKDEAYRQCMQTFVDYSNPLPKSIQYFDSMGALPFTKFLLGNQTNIINSINKNPTGALSWILANSFTNVSDIYGSILGLDSITNRWKMPGFGLWYDSLAMLPSMRITKAVADIL